MFQYGILRVIMGAEAFLALPRTGTTCIRVPRYEPGEAEESGGRYSPIVVGTLVTIIIVHIMHIRFAHVKKEEKERRPGGAQALGGCTYHVLSTNNKICRNRGSVVNIQGNNV